MASSLTNFARETILNAIANGVAFTPPTALWVAIHTADPTAVGNVGELSTSGTGYVRFKLNPNSGASPKWRLAAPDGIRYVVKNLDAVIFGPALTDWGSITHMSFWDAVTAGNPWYQGSLTSPRTVQTDGTLSDLSDDLVLILAGPQ